MIPGFKMNKHSFAIRRNMRITKPDIIYIAYIQRANHVMYVGNSRCSLHHGNTKDGLHRRLIQTVYPAASFSILRYFSDTEKAVKKIEGYIKVQSICITQQNVDNIAYKNSKSVGLSCE